MNVFDRSDPPARYAVKFYKLNPDDVDPPLDTLAVVEAGSDEKAAIVLARKLANKKYKTADQWEVVERQGLEWESFDGPLGCWEFRERNVRDSWEDDAEAKALAEETPKTAVRSKRR